MTRWIIGLGNPGSRYATTRHNAGVWMVDSLAETAGVPWTNAWFRPFFCARILRGEDELVLLKAKVFMNMSARAYAALWQKNQLDPARTLVVFDQMDLEPGVLRLKLSGGPGGHNGLKSLDALWQGAYARLAVGIGRPRGGVVEHVLGAPSDQEKVQIERAIGRGTALLLRVGFQGWEGLIHGINSGNKSPSNA